MEVLKSLLKSIFLPLILFLFLPNVQAAALGDVVDFTPTLFTVGQTTYLSVTIKNIGDQTGTFQLYAWQPDINWNMYGISTSYTLTAGEQRTITNHFYVTPNSSAANGVMTVKIWNTGTSNYDDSLSKSVTVFQNDAGSGGDAGNSFSSALSISPGSYSGYVDSGDTQDYYMFYASRDNIINITMTPPSNADFDLKLYGPDGYLKNSSTLGTGATERILHTATMSGNWRIEIYQYLPSSGSGIYTFSVNLPAKGKVVNFTPTTFTKGETTYLSLTVKNGGGEAGIFQFYGGSPDNNWNMYGLSDSYSLGAGEQRTINNQFWVTPNSSAASGNMTIKIYNTGTLQYDDALTKTVNVVAGNVTVNGTLYYRDNNAQNQFIKRARVELWDKDDTGGDDCLAGCTTNVYTDDYGYYNFPNVVNEDTDAGYGPLDIYLKIYAENPSIVRVLNSTNGVYINATSVINNTSNGPVTISQTITDNTAGAFNILSKVVEGYAYVAGQPSTSPPAQVEVMWYPGCCPDSTVASHYHPGGQIHILGSHQWERDIIVHEYGHYLMYAYYENSWVPDVNCPPSGHWFTDTTNPRCAYVEGWPTFFEASVKGVPTYDTSVGYWNLESSQHPPPNPPGGENVEGAITNIFWDIYDSNNDGQDTLYLGFDEIWDTFRNYETSSHHIYDINEFWDGWFDRSHNYRSQMNAIFWDHSIDKNTPPVATITSPNGGGTYSGTITVSASATDEDGTVSQTEFQYSTDSYSWNPISIDSNPAGGWSVQWDTSAISDYSVWVRARANDSMELGPWDASDSFFGLNVPSDSTPPSITFVSIANNVILQVKDVFVSWDASDSGSGMNHYEVRLQSNDTGWINVGLNTNYTFYNTSEGNHTFYLKAVDNANNNATETRNFTVNTSYVEPITEPQADILVFFWFADYDLKQDETIFADILLRNEGDADLEDGIRIMIFDASGTPVYKTWKRVEIKANDAVVIRFRDYKIPLNAPKGIWRFRVEFTEDAKWTAPGFRFFRVG